MESNELLDELRIASENIDRLYGTQLRRNDQLAAQIDKLWADVAALRDETTEALGALSNRIEANHANA